MGSVLKFIAFAFIALFILAFALPLLWLVIQEIGGLFWRFLLGNWRFRHRLGGSLCY